MSVVPSESFEWANYLDALHFAILLNRDFLRPIVGRTLMG